MSMAAKKAKELLQKERYHHGDLRRELLRIAREEIARNGAQAVSLASLAQLAGVSQPAPYRHFADRKALLEAVAAEGFEEFDHALADACVGCTPRVALDRMGRAYMAYGEANVELYRLMFASRLVPEADPGSPLARTADNSFDRLRSATSKVSIAATADKDALLLWARLHGLVMLRADGFINGPLSELSGPAMHISRKQNTKETC